MKWNVEKCGICEKEFVCDTDRDPIGLIQTDYLVPDDFTMCALNVLSETSKMNRVGISIICVDCADLMDSIRNTGQPAPEIKYIHDIRDGMYQAFPISDFQKISSQVQRKIKKEIESNSLYCFGKT